jgi:hypothetical protein
MPAILVNSTRRYEQIQTYIQNTEIWTQLYKQKKQLKDTKSIKLFPINHNFYQLCKEF